MGRQGGKHDVVLYILDTSSAVRRTDMKSPSAHPALLYAGH